MIIVDAVWEKRNLGVETKEITIEATDNQQTVKDTLSELNCEYAVVKLPSARPDLISVIQECGFCFVEDMVHLVSYLKIIERSALEERLDKAVSVEIMGEDEIDKIYCEIKKEMFATDRVILDNHFTVQQAQQRYINWEHFP